MSYYLVHVYGLSVIMIQPYWPLACDQCVVEELLLLFSFTWIIILSICYYWDFPYQLFGTQWSSLLTYFLTLCRWPVLVLTSVAAQIMRTLWMLGRCLVVGFWLLCCVFWGLCYLPDMYLTYLCWCQEIVDHIVMLWPYGLETCVMTHGGLCLVIWHYTNC